MARTLIRAQTQINNASDLGTEDGYFLRSDGSVSLDGNLSAGSNKITNLADPTNAGDVTNKSYVDGVAQGLDIKDSVRATTDGSNVDLTSTTDPNPIDGVTLADGDRVLLKDQTTDSENGIYDAVTATDPTTWTRSGDFDSDSEVTAGAFTFVAEGTSYADTGWVVSSDDPIAVGTDPILFTQFSGAGAISAGSGLTKSGDTINFNATDDSLTVNADDAQVAFDSTAATIELGDDGIRVANATAGTILIGQGTSTETAYTAVGGDISSLDSSGNFTIATSGSVIESTGSGIRLSQATAGDILVAQGTATDTTYQTLGGDVSSVDATGSVTLASAILREGDMVYRETPSGNIDGSNQTYTLANTPVTDTERVFYNGQLLIKGSTEDYTISSDTITLNFTPKSSPGNTDTIRVSYIYQSV